MGEVVRRWTDDGTETDWRDMDHSLRYSSRPLRLGEYRLLTIDVD
jgi:hypothetical protein